MKWIVIKPVEERLHECEMLARLYRNITSLRGIKLGSQESESRILTVGLQDSHVMEGVLPKPS